MIYKTEEEIRNARNEVIKLFTSCGVSEEDAEKYLSKYDGYPEQLDDILYGIIHNQDWSRETIERRGFKHAGMDFCIRFL